MGSDSPPPKGQRASPTSNTKDTSTVQEKPVNGHVDEESAHSVGVAPTTIDEDQDETLHINHYQIVNDMWQFFSVDYGHKCR